MAYNPKWNVFNRIIEGDTRIAVTDTGTGQAVVEVDGGQVANFLAAGLQMATGARVNEFSTDGTLAGNADTALPTEQAVKTYVDNAISNLNPDKIWQDDSYVQVVDDGTNAGYVTTVVDGVEVIRVSELEQTFGKADDTHITILDGTATVPVGSVEAFAIDEAGISVELGATINEFSTDGTLAGDSNTALPTEQAVKTYVDAQITTQSHEIFAGDSYVQVVDDGTTQAYVEVVINGTQVQYWDDAASTIRMGKASGAGRVTVNDTTVVASIAANNLLSITADLQTLGLSTDTYLRTAQTADTISGVANAVNVLSLTDTTQRVGIATASKLELDSSANTANLYAGTVNVLNATQTAQTFGVSGDTILSLDSSTNTVDLKAGNVSVLNATDTTQRFGASGDTNLTLNTSADTFTLSAGAVTQVSGTLTTITLGVSGDTTIVMDSGADQVAITAGGQSQLMVETSGTTVFDDLTVTGNLYVDGTTWVVHNQEVTTSDNIIVINNGEVGPGVTAGYAGLEIDRGSLTDYRFVFEESSDTFRVGEIGSLQAVATREDSPADMLVPWWNNTSKRFETAGSSSIAVNTTTDVITFTAASSPVATFESDGLTLASGTNVNEFSIDGTLAGDSDDAVPTEKAVKTYVDAQIGGQANIIFEGDSYVKVWDDTTAAGYIEIVADGVQVAYFDAEATSQRFGKAPIDGGFSIVTADASAYVQDTSGNNIANFTQDVQRIGLSGDTYLQTTQSTDSIVGLVGNVTVLNLSTSGYTLGQTGATYFSLGTALSGSATLRLGNVTYLQASASGQSMQVGLTANRMYIDTATSTVTLRAGSVDGLTLTSNTQTLGVAADTNIALSQSANTIVFEAANVTEATIDTNGLSLKSGASVNEFSIDGTLAGDSDDAVPTEKAVKTYVDTEIAAIDRTQIFEGDSYVRVVDDTTAAGYVEIVTDGIQVAYFDPQASTQRIGKASGAGRILVADNGVGAYVGTLEVLELGAGTQQLGIVDDTRVFLTQSTNSIILQANNTTEVTVNTSGFALKTGGAVNAISSDTNLGTSDTTLVTQSAIKAYVDAQIGNVQNIQYVYSDTTAVNGDILLVDTTAGDVNIEMIETSEARVVIKKVTTDGNNVIITASSGLIDGAASKTIDTAYQSYHFVSDGINYFIL